VICKFQQPSLVTAITVICSFNFLVCKKMMYILLYYYRYSKRRCVCVKNQMICWIIYIQFSTITKFHSVSSKLFIMNETVLFDEHSKLLAIRAAMDVLRNQIEILRESNSRHLVSSSTEFSSSRGDIAWVLSATVFVFLMTIPGIALYYSGMVRLQNVLSTAMQGYSIACVVTFLWLCFGYSFSFSPAVGSDESATVFGNTKRFWLSGITTGNHQLAPTIPESAFCVFELAFAIITPCLICGAFADRMKFSAVIVSLGLWHILVYCPMAHSNWHPDGFLTSAGVLDFAGGNVVHITAGVSAMMSAIIVGKRTGFGKGSFHPHNMLISLTGASFLMIGWYGFNSGSAFSANPQAGYALLNSQIARY
jgi:hypothetical protein